MITLKTTGNYYVTFAYGCFSNLGGFQVSLEYSTDGGSTWNPYGTYANMVNCASLNYTMSFIVSTTAANTQIQIINSGTTTIPLGFLNNPGHDLMLCPMAYINVMQIN